MKNRRSLAISSVGIILLLTTIVLFFIIQGNDIKASEILGLCFMIYSEIVVFGGLLAIEFLSDRNSQIMLRAGFGGTLILYGIISFIISFVYMCLGLEGIKVFWIIQILLFAIAAVLLIIFYTTSQSIKESDEKTFNTSNKND